MRLLVILLYYAVALLLGFYLRGRYDEAMYRTPHFQRRLRRWAAHVVAAPAVPVALPSTLEPHAFQPDAAVDALAVPDPPSGAAAGPSGEFPSGGAPASSPIEPR